MIDGTTKLIAHIGYPTESFKSPMIYNPYFEKHGINAVVVPMGCKADDYDAFLKLVFRDVNRVLRPGAPFIVSRRDFYAVMEVRLKPDATDSERGVD